MYQITDIPRIITFLEQNGYTVTPPDEDTDIDFELFWHAYDKKVGKAKAMKLWTKLSNRDRKAALDYCEPYRQAQPDKQYRKNPETFLRNRSWNDELVSSACRQPGLEEDTTISRLIQEQRQETLSKEDKAHALSLRIYEMIDLLHHNPQSQCRKSLIRLYNNGILKRLHINWQP